MRNFVRLCWAVLGAGLLAACGGGSSGGAVDLSGARGSLIRNPPLRVASVNAADFLANLSATASGAELLLIAGNPVCGIDFHYLQYGTVGGAGEATSASGALMVPTGPAGTCSGKRPILLYAHGTAS